MKKKTKEPVYRADDGSRWRFLEEGRGGWQGMWLMMRAKDGHRLYWYPKRLKLENH